MCIPSSSHRYSFGEKYGSHITILSRYAFTVLILQPLHCTALYCTVLSTYNISILPKRPIMPNLYSNEYVTLDNNTIHCRLQ
jgi:hypothetical protein